MLVVLSKINIFDAFFLFASYTVPLSNGTIKSGVNLGCEFPFKDKITNWKPVGCTCRLFKTYIQGIGYGVLEEGSLRILY